MQSTIQARNYVRTAAGLWTPVGFGGADTSLPVSIVAPGAQGSGLAGGVTSYGYIRASEEPGMLFHEPFDGTSLDTVDRWVTGGTQTPGVVSGYVSAGNLGTGAALSSSLSTRATFTNSGLNFLASGWVARFEGPGQTAGTAGYTNVHRFMGFGTQPTGTWTTAYTGGTTSGPLLNAIGFEIDVDGLMYAVVYSNGARTRVAPANGAANLTVGRTLMNASWHQFALVLRADAIFWYIDGTDVPVASFRYSSANFTLPAVQTLPLRFHTLNAASGTVAGSAGLDVAAVGIGDTGGNQDAISDPNFPWRRASVVAKGQSSNATVYGLNTQDLRDSNRYSFTLFGTNLTAGTSGTENMLTLSRAYFTDGTVTSASGSTFTIPAGRRWRFNQLSVQLVGNATTATAATALFRIRANAIGGVSVASGTPMYELRLTVPATLSATARAVADFPEGFEMAPPAAATTSTFAVGISMLPTYVTNAPTYDVALSGYEY